MYQVKAERNAQSEQSECTERSSVFIPSRAGNAILYRVGQRFSELGSAIPSRLFRVG